MKSKEDIQNALEIMMKLSKAIDDLDINIGITSKLRQEKERYDNEINLLVWILN
jgi:tRNA C32,U32 (ribose-2'-O)-methylase TrmJ